MKNQVIKVLNREHGKKVKEYWESKGDINVFSCSNNEAAGSAYIYYGFVNGKFDCLTLPQVLNRSIEIIELPEKKELKFPRWMMVGDREFSVCQERLVLTKLEGEFPYVCVVGGKENNTNGYPYIVIQFRFAKEINEIEELTMEEVCKELGRTIKIVTNK